MHKVALIFALTCLSWQVVAAGPVASARNNWFLASLPTPGEVTSKQVQFVQDFMTQLQQRKQQHSSLRQMAVSTDCEAAFNTMMAGMDESDPACQEVETMFASEDTAMPSDLEKLCSNTCWSTLVLNLEQTIDKCQNEKYATAEEKDVANSLMLMGHFVHFTCIKNENGKYCASVLSSSTNTEAQTEAEMCAMVKDAGCCFREYITFAFLAADMAVESASDAQVLSEAEREEIESSIDMLEKQCSVNLDIGCVSKAGEDGASAAAQAASTWTITIQMQLQLPSDALSKSNQDLFEAALAIDLARYLKISPGQVTVSVLTVEGTSVSVEATVVAVSDSNASDISTAAAKLKSDTTWSAELACSAIGVQPTDLKVQSAAVSEEAPKDDTAGTAGAVVSSIVAIAAAVAALRV